MTLPFIITSRMPADEMEKAGPAEARVSDDDVVDEPSVAEAERCVRLLEAEVVASPPPNLHC